MATNTKTSIAARNLEADAIGGAADNGYIRIYDGTQAATPETAPGGTLLAECRLNADAFPAASGGVLTANAITADNSINATGTASWFRVLKSDGTTVLWDDNAGTSGTAMVLSTTSLVAGAQLSISSLTYSIPQ